MSAPDPDYRLLSSEPGVFVELYLPKKAQYQGTLYQTLTEGLNPERVRPHYLDPQKRPAIRAFLQENSECRDFAQYDDAFVTQLPGDLFRGYTMYEVDGVFRSDKGVVYEERAQVLRLIFKYALPNDGSAEAERQLWLAKAFLRSPISSVPQFRQHQTEHWSAADEQFLDELGRWIVYVEFFVFGFILFEICYRIRELVHREQSPEHGQEEIWVTSFWNLSINRVIDRQRQLHGT